MRHHGMVESSVGLSVHDHVCWTYDSDDQYRSAVLEFLDNGRRLDQRLLYVRNAPIETAREDLLPLGEVDAMLEGGSLQIMSLPSADDSDVTLDLAAQFKTYVRATDEALAEGYAGLRMAGEGTHSVLEPAARDLHARWEAIADRYMASRPMASLCCFDRRVLPDDVIMDLAAIHPVIHAPQRVTRFQLFSETDALMLAGNVDYFDVDRLDRMLHVALPEDEDVVLDLSTLEFIDHHGASMLAKHRRRLADRGARLSIRGASPGVRRLCELMNLPL